jgi:hypothetical protein
MPVKKPIPQRLKKLESSDYMQVRDANGDILVVTKQETNAVIKQMLEREYNLLSEKTIKRLEKKLFDLVETRISQIEKDADAFIGLKIDEMAEKICDMLITRKFKEEVEKKAEELLIQKQIKGKF